MFITLTTLERLDACDDYLETFAGLFPYGVEVTAQVCGEYAEEFLWGWAVDELLSTEGQQRYLRALEARDLDDEDAAPEVVEVQTRIDQNQRRFRSLLEDLSAEHRVNLRRLINIRRVDEGTRRLVDDHLARYHQVRDALEHQLTVCRARLFGTLAATYEAERVRWATDGCNLDRLYGSDSYRTTTTPTTASAGRRPPEKKERGEPIT